MGNRMQYTGSSWRGLAASELVGYLTFSSCRIGLAFDGLIQLASQSQRQTSPVQCLHSGISLCVPSHFTTIKYGDCVIFQLFG